MIWLKLLRNVRSQGFLRLASVLMVACIGALIIRVGYVEGLGCGFFLLNPRAVFTQATSSHAEARSPRFVVDPRLWT